MSSCIRTRCRKRPRLSSIARHESSFTSWPASQGGKSHRVYHMYTIYSVQYVRDTGRDPGTLQLTSYVSANPKLSDGNSPQKGPEPRDPSLSLMAAEPCDLKYTLRNAGKFEKAYQGGILPRPLRSNRRDQQSSMHNARCGTSRRASAKA